MRFPSKEVFFKGYVFRVSEDVYDPAEDSFLFAENLVVKRGDRVLDVGTGCGLLGIVAAKVASLVVGVDVNPLRFAVLGRMRDSIVWRIRCNLCWVTFLRRCARM